MRKPKKPKLPITRLMTNNMKNMRALRKIIVIITLFATLVPALFSCDRKYDEAEVISAAETLIKKSALIEDILFGEGFSTDMMDTNIGYKKVEPASIKQYSEKLGESFSDLAGFRAVISKVYTAGYANDIFSGVLYGTIDSHTRYYQDGDYIMADTTFERRKVDSITYHYSTLKVEDVNGEKITVSIDITITTKDGKSQNRNIEVDMLEEASGWKLDTPTFAVYNENYNDYKDLEDELNKKK